MRRIVQVVFALVLFACIWAPLRPTRAAAAGTTRNCGFSYTNQENMNRVLDKLDFALGQLYVSCNTSVSKFVTTSTSSSSTTSTSSSTTTSTSS